MFNARINQWLIWCSSTALVLLWSYSAFSKLWHFETFHIQLRQHELFESHPILIGIAVVVAELLLCLFLLWSKYLRWGLIGSLLLLSLFTVYLMGMLWFKQDHLPCSCGGIISQLSWTQHIWFNLAFLFLSFLGSFASLSTTKTIQDYADALATAPPGPKKTSDQAE